jgi:hypothetical protein
VGGRYRDGETTVTWPQFPVLGRSPLLDEVSNLQVGPMLDDDQAQSQAAHGEFGLPCFTQVVYRGLDLETDFF